MAKVKGESNEVLKVGPGAWQLHCGGLPPPCPLIGLRAPRTKIAYAEVLGGSSGASHVHLGGCKQL